MTKDLAILIDRDAPWLNTQDFLARIDDNLRAAMGQSSAFSHQSSEKAHA